MPEDRSAPTPTTVGNQVRRLAILGELLAEMSHEINNLMMGVLGYAELELNRERDPKSVHNLQRIYECAQSVRDLTRNLLRFARPPEADVAGSVLEAVDSVLEIFGRRAKSRNVAIECDLPPAMPPIAVATCDLRLILANLVKNALDALEDMPSRIIRLTATEKVGKLTLSIWNAGPPISERNLAHLFDPFFTTKPGGMGTGLGLSISQRLLSQVGGKLSAQNAEDGGVLFTLDLPLASSRIPNAHLDGTKEVASLQGRRVLVVDDENTAREVLMLMVSQMGGAAVDACSTGEEALKLLGIEDFDAVVLDLRMAGLSGQDVYRCLPDEMKRRVVFVTGDTLRSSTKRFLEGTKQPTLFKPVEYKELLEAVRKVAAH